MVIHMLKLSNYLLACRGGWSQHLCYTMIHLVFDVKRLSFAFNKVATNHLSSCNRCGVPRAPVHYSVTVGWTTFPTVAPRGSGIYEGPRINVDVLLILELRKKQQGLASGSSTKMVAKRFRMDSGSCHIVNSHIYPYRSMYTEAQSHCTGVHWLQGNSRAHDVTWPFATYVIAPISIML